MSAQPKIVIIAGPNGAGKPPSRAPFCRRKRSAPVSSTPT